QSSAAFRMPDSFNRNPAALPHLHFRVLCYMLWRNMCRPRTGPHKCTMGLYYKDLISKDASLDKLVDDLMLVVQGASELAEAAGHLDPEQNAELHSKIEKLKEACNRIRGHAVTGMRATDKLLRRHPYSS